MQQQILMQDVLQFLSAILFLIIFLTDKFAPYALYIKSTALSAVCPVLIICKTWIQKTCLFYCIKQSLLAGL